MQYKKDELKQAILAAAESEFLEQGYNNASLRSIAKQAGTTIGNLYHYYDNKEGLFGELVKDEYNAFVYMINDHSAMTVSEKDNLSDIVTWRRILAQFIKKRMPIFTKRFLILIDLSEGTKYETAKVEFINFVRIHFLEHIEASKQIVSSQFAQLLAEQLIYGIINIIRNYEDEDTKYQLICDLFFFNIIGIINISNRC